MTKSRQSLKMPAAALDHVLRQHSVSCELCFHRCISPVAVPPLRASEAGNYRRIPVSLSEGLDNGSPETLSLWKPNAASGVGYKAIRRLVVCLYEPVCRAM
jgi:hypothetical protein